MLLICDYGCEWCVLWALVSVSLPGHIVLLVFLILSPAHYLVQILHIRFDMFAMLACWSSACIFCGSSVKSLLDILAFDFCLPTHQWAFSQTPHSLVAAFLALKWWRPAAAFLCTPSPFAWKCIWHPHNNKNNKNTCPLGSVRLCRLEH